MIDIKVLASGSSGNCYSISDGKTSLLLDAGIPINKISEGLNFNLSSVSAALITHRHGDHSKSVKNLTKRGIDVYACLDVFESLKLFNHRCHIIKSGINENGQAEEKTKIGTFTVLPFDCNHDVPNLGYYIHSEFTGENLLYFTDTFYIKYVFPDINYLLCEANYSADKLRFSEINQTLKNRIMHSHMSIDNLLNMLKSNDLSKVKQIYLLHLSENNSNEELFKFKVQELCGCEVYTY